MSEVDDGLKKITKSSEAYIHTTELKRRVYYEAIADGVSPKFMFKHLANDLADADINNIQMHVQLMELITRIHEDINTLKQATLSLAIGNQSILKDVDNIKTLQEKREEMLSYIDETVKKAKETEKRDEEEREKWR